MRTSEITTKCVNSKITVQGWVHRTRDHGGLTFIDLRDYDGLIQCVFDSYEGNIDFHHLRDESVVRMTGFIETRPAGTHNPNLSTGIVELKVTEIEVLNEADILPFKVFAEDEEYTPSLEQRLKYRYLDLRREENQKMLKMRSDLMHFVRNVMHGDDFTEVHTPILTAPSPEGARDYIVPSRLHPGKYFCLPQAPQLFKELLISSGIKRYMQIAPCFRDEAGRSDRSPGEFYQIDMEMAFATQDEVFEVAGGLLETIFEKFGQYDVQPHSDWEQIPYNESIKKYGTDKPDLRASLEMIDLTDLFREEGPPFIVDAVKKGQVVKALHIGNADELTGKFYKDLEKYAQDLGMPGLGYIKTGVGVGTGEGQVSGGPLVKFMTDAHIKALEAATSANVRSNTIQATFLMVGRPKAVNIWGADLRVELSKRTGNFNEESYEFCWIVDFPFFEENEETEKLDFSHNPFSMPVGGMEALENENPLDILAYQFDCVINGFESLSGGIRNHHPETMLKVFDIVGYDEQVVRERFSSLFEAFKYGTPPHGGCAIGFDRVLMILLKKDAIREVIAFPLNNQAQDLMMNAPCEVSTEQLKELGIKFQKK